MHNKKGFSLVEILVAILVLTMAVVSASNFLVSMMRSNAMNTSVLQAYYYSVEGLEAFRNMRDTYFMNYLNFCGSGDDIGLFGPEGGFCEEGSYAVNVKDSVLDDRAITLIKNGEGTVTGAESFKRICDVAKVGEAEDELQVTCITTYNDNGRIGEVALKTILTNWKQ